MERKYFVKDTGKEAHIGDELSITRVKETDLGKVIRTTVFTITKENVNKLIEKGIIAVKEHLTIDSCLASIARKANQHITDVFTMYNKLLAIYPPAALSLILRTIAVEFEERSNTSINKVDTVYFINTLTGCIGNAPASSVSNLNNFGAFKSLEDAKEALEICKPILDIMYGKQEGKERNK